MTPLLDGFANASEPAPSGTTMREKPTRKCARFVNLTNFDCRHDVRLTHNVGLTQGFQPTRDIKLALIQAYGAWVQQQLDEGWDGYLFTFAFNQLPGSIRAKSQLMER